MSDDNEIHVPLHSAVGTGAGGVHDGTRIVPVVTLHFVKDTETLEQLEDDAIDFDPSDPALWDSYALTVRGARQLIADLNEMIDAAIAKPLE